MKKFILIMLFAFQLNSSSAQGLCDSTLITCDYISFDSAWISHHPEYGDWLHVRLWMDQDFLHGPAFVFCPEPDSVQFLNNSFPFFGIIGPTSINFHYVFEDFDSTYENISGSIILDNTGEVLLPHCIIEDFNITVDDSTTAVNDIIVENEIEVFPNPADQSLTIKLENPNATINEIRLFDLMGRKQTIEISEQLIDVSNLSSGMYVLQVLLNNERAVTKNIFIK